MTKTTLTASRDHFNHILDPHLLQQRTSSLPFNIFLKYAAGCNHTCMSLLPFSPCDSTNASAPPDCVTLQLTC